MNYETLIQELETASMAQDKSSTQKVLDTLAKIFRQLDERGLDIELFSQHTSEIHSAIQSEELKFGEISRIKNGLTQTLMKEHGLTTKGYHQNLWLVLGMSLFGIPLGMIFGFSLDNFAFFGLGLPMGMPIGVAIGMQKEKKAQEAGTVLAI
ncbi:hypothetical protein [Roseivirga sp.]|uniref:hypothetical protein n=1 Tax=Roseivirga sp. TaxID=1964215 RepID=UPI003B8B7D4E